MTPLALFRSLKSAKKSVVKTVSPLFPLIDKKLFNRGQVGEQVRNLLLNTVPKRHLLSPNSAATVIDEASTLKNIVENKKYTTFLAHREALHIRPEDRKNKKLLDSIPGFMVDYALINPLEVI